jgi:hypothetical protein
MSSSIRIDRAFDETDIYNMGRKFNTDGILEGLLGTTLGIAGERYETFEKPPLLPNLALRFTACLRWAQISHQPLIGEL